MADINERLMNGEGLAELWSLIGNKYNGVYEHWWRRRSSVTGAVEDSTTGASVTVHDLGGDYCADSYTKDPAAGVYTLVNPTEIKGTNVSSLKGKYVILDGTSGSEMYFIPESATFEAGSTIVSGYSGVTLMSISFVTDTGTWDYVSSENRNAYPDIGVSGNWEYVYLGMPFENARDGLKAQTGSYVGTGTNKEAGANSITFDFVPSVVIIHSETTTNYQPAFAIFTPVLLTSTYTKNGYILFKTDTGDNYAKIEGTTLSWYTTTSASGFTGDPQMNTSGVTFKWVAIG